MANRRFRWRWIGLAAPVVLVLGLAAYDFVAVLWDTHKLGDAAFAATRWARAYRYDPDEMAKAAASETTLRNIKVTASHPCGCPAGIELAQSECGATCRGGGWAQPYIIVTASMCYTTALPWPGVSYCSSGDSLCAASGCNTRQIMLSAQAAARQ